MSQEDTRAPWAADKAHMAQHWKNIGEKKPLPNVLD